MNLVIGHSQLSHYFPEDYIKISSRNVDLQYLRSHQWDSVYLTFAEQRVHSTEEVIDYITPNFIKTLEIIEALLDQCQKICCYTSGEAWNNLSGPITLDTPPKFISSNDYIKSKLLLLNKIKTLRLENPKYQKVIFIHPLYFNSVYRKKYFLFGKIFDSILNHTKIEVGSLDFHRDMVHASLVAQKSMEATSDLIVGAGQLFHVRTFIKDLYQLNNLDFDYYVQEDTSRPFLGQPKLIMAQVPWTYTYQDLLRDTQEDILKYHGLI